MVKVLLVGLVELTSTTDGEIERSQFIMIYNVDAQKIEKIRFFSRSQYPDISSINYGPFDNNYIMVGFTNGLLVSLDF